MTFRSHVMPKKDQWRHWWIKYICDPYMIYLAVLTFTYLYLRWRAMSGERLLEKFISGLRPLWCLCFLDQYIDSGSRDLLLFKSRASLGGEMSQWYSSMSGQVWFLGKQSDNLSSSLWPFKSSSFRLDSLSVWNVGEWQATLESEVEIVSDSASGMECFEYRDSPDRLKVLVRGSFKDRGRSTDPLRSLPIVLEEWAFTLCFEPWYVKGTFLFCLFRVLRSTAYSSCSPEAEIFFLFWAVLLFELDSKLLLRFWKYPLCVFRNDTISECRRSVCFSEYSLAMEGRRRISSGLRFDRWHFLLNDCCLPAVISVEMSVNIACSLSDDRQ